MRILTNYFLNSSLHGLHFIADTRLHWSERLFWLISTLASWITAFYVITIIVQNYQYQSTKQSVSFSVDTSYLDWKTNFPSIVICEKNNPSKMDELNEKIFGTTTEHFPKIEQFVFFDGTMRYHEHCSVYGEFRDKCILSNYSAYTLKYRSTCSEIIGSCYYNDEQFDCCDEFLPIDSYHGRCFAFNSLIPKELTSRDQLPYKINSLRNGNLSIELFHPYFFVYALSQDSVPTKDSAKEYALIGSAKNELLEVDTYYQSFIAVEETVTEEDVKRLSIKNRGCRFYYENNLKHSKVYSLSACENDCLVEAQKKICNCTVHTMPHNDQTKECDFDSLLCVIGNEQIATRSKQCKCLGSCFETDILNIGFTSSFINNEMFKDQRSVLKIDFIVRYSTIRFTRGTLKDPLSLLVVSGGAAGLFLGASLLTIIEIIYYFIIRPLGDKYLESQKNKILKKSKETQINLFDAYYFEYVN